MPALNAPPLSPREGPMGCVTSWRRARWQTRHGRWGSSSGIRPRTRQSTSICAQCAGQPPRR
eukprot:2163782-Pyramimonas_sp.AAC.1